MAIGSIEDRIIAGLSRKTGVPRLDNLTVNYLGAPDKTDPFNERAILTAKANVGVTLCAWVIECKNDGSQDVQGRLIQGMISAIAEQPNKSLSVAVANTVMLA